LWQLYIEDLTKMVNWTGSPRPRVRNPEKWRKLDTRIALKEGIEQQLVLPPLDCERKVWVWSDLHFFHKNIIEFSDRPYDNVEQMNEHLVANHNDYVGANDISIWVGDVGFANETKINELLDQCSGYKILILGNHDFHRRKRPLKLNFDETHLCYLMDTPEVGLFFTHYPMYNIPEGPWVNIHGHLHAFPKSDSGHPRHINVNCEIQEYKPKLLDDIIKMAKMRLIAAEL